MADLTPFGDEAFDPVSWVNAALADRPSEQGAEKFLAEMEMRLQLAAEELEVSLAETSAAALRRVPYAQQEVLRLQSESAALATGAAALLAATAADAAAAGAAAAPLAAMHSVKVRMEAACATLKEATELSGAFRQVEDLFSTGDLPRVAELLRSMGRSLALVGDVPEFREGKAKLSALEDRLQRRVEGRLTDALAADDANEVGALAHILLAVGRGATLEKLYSASRTPRIEAAWSAATAPKPPPTMTDGSGGDDGGAQAAGRAPQQQQQQQQQQHGAEGLAGGQLLAGYTAVLGVLGTESGWLGSCLAEQRARLVESLVVLALNKINKPISVRLSGASAAPLLPALLADGLVMVRGVASTLRGAGADEAAVANAVRLALEPLEEQVTRFSLMEEASLSSDLAACLGCDPTTSDLDAAAAALTNSVDAAFNCMRSSIDRCVAVTGGTELRPLLRVLDAECQQYLTRLQAAAGVLHGRFAAAAAAAAAAPAQAGVVSAPDDLASILSLVLVARRAGAALAGLEAGLRAAIATAVPRLAAAAAAGPNAAAAAHHATAASAARPGGGGGAAAAQAGAPHAAAVSAAALAELLPFRLAAFPGKLPVLERLRDQVASDPRFIALRAATAAADALYETVSGLVYSAVLSPVERALGVLPQLPAWPAAGVGGGGAPAAGGAMVPQFSAYPLAVVTGVGEYLMSLPGHLEVLMAEEEVTSGDEGGGAGGGAAGGDELAAEWLDKVVRGAGLMYADAILRIPGLGSGGAAQLAADAEYYCNVMSALAVAPPAVLITVQVFAALPADQFSEAASAAVAEGSADPKVLRQLAAMRGGIGWEGGGAAAMGGGEGEGAAEGGGGAEYPGAAE